jgi:hypothetical protein
VILRLNIVEPHHQRLGEEEIREVVAVPDAICLSLEQTYERAMSPRHWRALARRLDSLVAEARQAGGRSARYVIAGRAPLPVYAYLGASIVRVRSVSIANDLGGEWEFFAPLHYYTTPGRDDFTVAQPSLGRDREGRVALSVYCSNAYGDATSSIDDMLAAEGVKLLDTYAIARPVDHLKVPLSSAALPVVLEHVGRAIEWIRREVPSSDGLPIAFGGPNWVAYWIIPARRPRRQCRPSSRCACRKQRRRRCGASVRRPTRTRS